MENEKRLIDPYDLTIHLAQKNAKHPLQYDDVLAVIADEKRVDAVEVVRCKGCKHWKFIDSLNPHWECQIFYGLHECGYLTGSDDFCSYGERRTDV